MDLAFFVLFIVFMLILLWAVAVYNDLVKKQNHVREAWSNIDVQLKRRYNLIPNLVETVKGYMVHERTVLESVTETREQCVQTAEDNPTKKLLYAENMLTGALGEFWARVEAYPDLKANETFLKLQRELSDVENHIQMARRYFNGSVRDLNIRIESFPSNLIAKLFKFEVQAFFQIENPMERLVPKVDLGESKTS